MDGQGQGAPQAGAAGAAAGLPEGLGRVLTQMEAAVTEANNQVRALARVVEQEREEALREREDSHRRQEHLQQGLQDLERRREGDRQAIAAEIRNRPRGGKISRIPLFDGTTNWISWRAAFLRGAQANGWTWGEAVLTCPNYMVGDAAEAVLDVPYRQFGPVADMIEQDLHDYLDLCEAKFMPAGASDLAQAQFDREVQGVQESILKWHGRVRTLYRRANPGIQLDLNPAAQMAMVRKFIDGIRNRQASMNIQRRSPTNMDAALEAAQREFAILLRNKDPWTSKSSLPWAGGSMAGPSHHGLVKGEPMEIGELSADKTVTTDGPILARGVEAIGGNPNPGIGRGGASRRGRPGTQRGPQRTGTTTTAGNKVVASDKCHLCGEEGHFRLQCPNLSVEGREALTRVLREVRTKKKNVGRTIQEVTAATADAEEDFP